MNITTSLFDAALKCSTKCFLRSRGEAGKGNVYADWLRAQTESYRGTGIKGLMAGAAHDELIIRAPGSENLNTAEWRLAVDVMAHAQNLESSLHAVERVPVNARGQPTQIIPIRFIFTNKLTRDDKLATGIRCARIVGNAGPRDKLRQDHTRRQLRHAEGTDLGFDKRGTEN